jgi:hypothetical protein
LCSSKPVIEHPCLLRWLQEKLSLIQLNQVKLFLPLLKKPAKIKFSLINLINKKISQKIACYGFKPDSGMKKGNLFTLVN